MHSHTKIHFNQYVTQTLLNAHIVLYVMVTLVLFPAMAILSCIGHPTPELPTAEERFGPGWDILATAELDECPETCDSARCWNIMSACHGAECPEYPYATCVVNYCNGCNHYFVHNNGSRVIGCGTCADL